MNIAYDFDVLEQFRTVPLCIVYYVVFHYEFGLRFLMLYTQLMCACMRLTTRYENSIETKYNDRERKKT